MRRAVVWTRRVAGIGAALLLGGCISVGLGGDAAAQRQLALRDAAALPPARRAEPLVDVLLIQGQPADALADTLSIAYSPQPNEFAFYQLAHWTERPVRHIPRLLQQRLEARGVAGAVGLVGEPMRADWLLTLRVDTIHHDMREPPGAARLAITVELFDRRGRVRVAQRRFDTRSDCARADSSAAADAMSRSVALAFDALLPWLEDALQRATAAPR